MSMFRFWGAAMLPLCGWFLGGSLRQKSLLHIEELEKTVLLLQRLKQEILFRRADLKQLYQTLCSEGILEKQPEAGTFQETLPPTSFSSAEKACFRECMQSLGKTQAVQQAELLDFYQSRFESFLQKARTDTEKQASLPCQIGACAGAILALFFL